MLFLVLGDFLKIQQQQFWISYVKNS